MNLQVIDPAKLDGLHLAKGAHDSPDDGLCLVEALNYALGRPHSDRTPPCTSPVLGDMGRGLNDVLPDDRRQELFPLLLDLPGTADGHDEQRSYMALDWLIRTWLPTWLELSPACRKDAARVRELGRIVDLESAERAAPVVHQARETARAAGDAACAAPRDAPRDVAWDAAWAAAWAAAWTVAGAAAGDAAWDAAGDAARDAARDVLAPTVGQLQRSAIELYGRMVRAGQGAA